MSGFLWVLMLMSGCKSGPVRNLSSLQRPAFAEHYRRAVQAAVAPVEQAEDQQRITVACEGMRLAEFVRLVAQRSGVSIVVEEAIDERIVSLDVRDQPVNDVLAAVSRRVGVQVSRTGDLYFVGSLRPEDKGVLVVPVGRLDRESVLSAVGTLTSEHGRATCDVDGLLVLGDRVEVLQRVSELVGRINAAAGTTWVVQLYVVGLSESAVDDLGVNFAPAANVALAFASGGSVEATINLNAALDAIFSYEQSGGDLATLAAPTFLVRNGVEGHTFVGETVPVARRTTSSEGTVTTEGFDQIDVGLDIKVTVRESGPGALLVAAVDRSRIAGYVEGAPRTTSEQFSSEAFVKSGGVYLLGELERGDFESGTGGAFRLGRREVDRWDLIQFWARLHRVDAPSVGGKRGRVIPTPEQREASPAAMSGSETLDGGRVPLWEKDEHCPPPVSSSGSDSVGLAGSPVSGERPVSGGPGPALSDPAMCGPTVYERMRDDGQSESP